MGFDATVITDNLPLLLAGFSATVVISVVSLFGALILGALVALARLSRIRSLAFAGALYVEIFRNVPFMIQVFLIYYALPFYGIRFPPYVVGIVALTMFSAAYFAEIIRSAILSVPRGQLESARATGMSVTQAMRHVIFPQMLAFLIPPATNQATSLVKESAVLSTITVAEMTMAAQRIQLETYSFVEPLIVIAALYWIFNAGLMYAARRLEVAMQPFRHAARVSATT